MRAYDKILSLVLLLSTCSSAQEIPNCNKQAGRQLMKDEGEENHIAKLFDASRANATNQGSYGAGPIEPGGGVRRVAYVAWGSHGRRRGEG